ncbi:MAG: hypothetical protein F4Z40_02020 [Chloroflexi bacterium]|nr:hypothetical protein [Chloroflexota bacterium]
MPEIAMCSGSIFTPSAPEMSTQLIGKLLEELSDLNSPPIAMPVPENMPREIPRVILTSGDGTIEARLAPARSDIIWRRSTPEVQTLPELARNVAEHLLKIHNAIGGPISRFGFIANHFLEVNEPSLRLTASYISESAQARMPDPLAQFEIHWLTRDQLGEFGENNHWVKLRTATINRGSDSVESPVISIENDVNTVVSDNQVRNFEHTQIPCFFAAAANRILDHLDQLVPQ